MRSLLAALTIAVLPSAVLADDDHHHLAEADGLRVLHAWTPARAAGEEALIYMEIENRSSADAVLTGAEAMGRPLELVGFQYGSTGENWIVLPGLSIASGTRLMLEPRVMALRLAPLPQVLTEGQDLEVGVDIGGIRLDAHVEVGARGATAHSHAGHAH